ncbi:hypothetical protein Bbelb_056510 [Branchiostoma belcheri]|nr:hypothetical protein Bbelb_056510 [Branchiostoma belcheri]
MCQFQRRRTVASFDENRRGLPFRAERISPFGPLSAGVLFAAVVEDQLNVPELLAAADRRETLPCPPDDQVKLAPDSETSCALSVEPNYWICLPRVLEPGLTEIKLS